MMNTTIKIGIYMSMENLINIREISTGSDNNCHNYRHFNHELFG